VATSLVLLTPRSDRIYSSGNRSVLVTDREGTVDGGDTGLWVYETRMLSRHRWLVRGTAPVSAGASLVGADRWQGYACAPGHEGADAAQQAVGLHIARAVGDGLHEDIELVNHTQEPTTLRLTLELDADFAAASETRGPRRQTGRLDRSWRPRARELVFDYVTKHAYDHGVERGVARLHRGMVVRVEHAASPPVDTGQGIAFDVVLPPRATWRACLRFVPHIEGRALEVPAPCAVPGRPRSDAREARRESWLAAATGFEATVAPALTSTVLAAIERAKDDLASLRLTDLDLGDQAWTFAGGLPTYLTFFGRDALVASLEASLLGPEMLSGTLTHLARTQADRVDDWRDEQPGRIVHELHTGPLASLEYTPHGRYYGDVTASLLFPVALSALFHRTGDAAEARRHLGPALRALAWADENALGPDGFYRYETRSSQGEKNQGWKDSGDAIVWPDGSQVDAPLGTCEMQAFAFMAKWHLAETLVWLGEREEARRLFREARALKRRFNAKFWMEDEGYLALAIDAHGTPVRTIASDPGHCLMSGIVDRARVAAVGARMFAPDLFSGWGVRTLSSENPAFSPFAYHRGTVWPAENAAFAVGFARYGFVRELHALCKAQFEAAALFDHARLPELFAGHARDESHPFPGLYPKANWPQAWSASAVIAMVNALTGIVPYAPMHTVIVDPHLPEWLPELTVRDLRVGAGSVSLRFSRRPDGATTYSIIDRQGPLHVVRRPSPRTWAGRVSRGLHDLALRVA
jgi:glycogen debranching enzyme